MFQRNSVDRDTDNSRKTIAVKIVLDDGQVLSGACHVAMTRSLGEELNQPGPFLDFESYQGERAFISKSSIARITRLDMPKADQLSRAASNSERADPYTILGIPRGADRSTVQAAYHGLAKQYHPDRFAGLDLPGEMAQYASDMARRVNEAYSMLRERERHETVVHVDEPVTATAPRSAYDAFVARSANRAG